MHHGAMRPPEDKVHVRNSEDCFILDVVIMADIRVLISTNEQKKIAEIIRAYIFSTQNAQQVAHASNAHVSYGMTR